MRNLILSGVLALVVAATAHGQGYVVETVAFSSEGRTGEYQLSLKAGIEAGQYFQDRAALELFLADRTQVLLNERVLDTVFINAEEGLPLPDGKIPVTVYVSTRDTWNIIALPYFNYDSNTGLLLSVRARDYNFLGSMEALRINLNMDQELSGDLFWGADADFSYPFPAFGLDWAWNLEGDFSMPDDGGPVQGKAATGISASVPLALGDLQLTLTQAAKFNQQDDDVPYLDEAYFSTTAQIGWRLPVDLSFSRYPTVLRPRVELGANWLPGGLQDGELARGPALESGFGLSHGRIDWLGNFRKGLMATADVSATYYLSDASFARKVTLEASAFNEAGWWGSGMRAYAVWSPEKDSNGAGSVVRGVLNSRAATDAAVAINLDLPVRVLRFVPFEWFGKPWMKVFQFEQHWSPFVDAALGHYDGTWFNPEKGWYGAGLEVMTFPLAMRSFYVRISIGWSLSDVVALGALEGKSPRDGRSIYELFFGLGHHY